jgi:hypothetical protein
MKPEIKIFQAKDFNSREDLESAIVSELGKTTDKKDASITGTVTELLKLQLSHGQSVWGVIVEATDFQPDPVVEKPKRGPQFKSSLNYSKNEAD